MKTNSYRFSFAMACACLCLGLAGCKTEDKPAAKAHATTKPPVTKPSPAPDQTAKPAPAPELIVKTTRGPGREENLIPLADGCKCAEKYKAESFDADAVRGLDKMLTECFKKAKRPILSNEKICVPFPLGLDKRNGKSLEVSYYCSDMCPANGVFYVRYKDVARDKCESAGGIPRRSVGWGGYMGCIPKELEAINQARVENHAPLIREVLLGDVKRVAKMLDDGAAVNELDKRNMTALHHAASSCNLEMVQLLLAKGAQLESKNYKNFSPLTYMAYSKNTKPCLKVFKLLIKKGADIYRTDSSQSSLLHLAALNSHVLIAKELIRKGLDVNARNDGKKTPLHLVAGSEHPDSLEFIKLLLSKGARTDVTSYKGLTPLDHAKSNPEHEKLLKQAAKKK
jgi:ankyrin repeat protein